jgi:L-fucose isomerase-like protein
VYNIINDGGKYMNINYLEIRSLITPISENIVTSFFKEIEKIGNFTLTKVTSEEWFNLDFGIIYIATGGTEGVFLEKFEEYTKKPCYILTSGESNSLAASMEILSYLKNHGKEGEILHGDAPFIAKRINTIVTANKAVTNFIGSRIGVFGKPSDWLISSSYNKEQLYKEFNITVIEIPMEEIIKEIKLEKYLDNENTLKLKAMNYDKTELEKSLNVYGAFKRIVNKNNLNGFTVRCFDLLDTVFTTGCIGLAILNSEGIYSGCEGDVPALISMMILGEISGKPVFQCNPSRINLQTKEMVLAHCTLPLNLPYKMSLTTHFESGIGVAIAGSIKEGKITIFKTSGDLGRYYVNNGNIIENLRENNLCRSQIKITLDNYSYFTTNPISNHHLVCIGDYTNEIKEFFKLIKKL